MDTNSRDTASTCANVPDADGARKCSRLRAPIDESSANHSDVVFSHTSCHGDMPEPEKPDTRRVPVAEFWFAVTCDVGSPEPTAKTPCQPASL